MCLENGFKFDGVALLGSKEKQRCQNKGNKGEIRERVRGPGIENVVRIFFRGNAIYEYNERRSLSQSRNLLLIPSDRFDFSFQPPFSSPLHPQIDPSPIHPAQKFPLSKPPADKTSKHKIKCRVFPPHPPKRREDFTELSGEFGGSNQTHVSNGRSLKLRRKERRLVSANAKRVERRVGSRRGGFHLAGKSDGERERLTYVLRTRELNFHPP